MALDYLKNYISSNKSTKDSDAGPSASTRAASSDVMGGSATRSVVCVFYWPEVPYRQPGRFSLQPCGGDSTRQVGEDEPHRMGPRLLIVRLRSSFCGRTLLLLHLHLVARRLPRSRPCPTRNSTNAPWPRGPRLARQVGSPLISPPCRRSMSGSRTHASQSLRTKIQPVWMISYQMVRFKRTFARIPHVCQLSSLHSSGVRVVVGVGAPTRSRLGIAWSSRFWFSSAMANTSSTSSATKPYAMRNYLSRYDRTNSHGNLRTRTNCSIAFRKSSCDSAQSDFTGTLRMSLTTADHCLS